MLKVGVTGGIGSGKSVVCRVFAALGIPVFNADEAARYVMANDQALKHAITGLLGEVVYVSGKPDRERIAAMVFGDAGKLKQLNALVHPVTIAYANDWMSAQEGAYAIKEAAIFFESGSYKEMDVMVGVFAPVDLRLARTVIRSGFTEEKVSAIMAQQMDEDEKMNRCDHVIINDDQQALLPQVLMLHEIFLSRRHL